MRCLGRRRRGGQRPSRASGVRLQQALDPIRRRDQNRLRHVGNLPQAGRFMWCRKLRRVRVIYAPISKRYSPPPSTHFFNWPLLRDLGIKAYHPRAEYAPERRFGAERDD